MTYCELSDLPVDQCSCRLHAEPEPKAAESEIVARFTARFRGWCGNCSARVHADDQIAKTADGDFLCERCWP